MYFMTLKDNIQYFKVTKFVVYKNQYIPIVA